MLDEDSEAVHQMKGRTAGKCPGGEGLLERGGGTQEPGSREGDLRTIPFYPESADVREQRRHLSQLPVPYPMVSRPADVHVPKCPDGAWGPPRSQRGPPNPCYLPKQ